MKQKIDPNQKPFIQPICKNKKEALELVKMDGRSLKYVSDELKDDKEVVLAAVKRFPGIWLYASKRLRDSKDVALMVINGGGTYWFRYMSEELQNDKELVFKAIKQSRGVVFSRINLETRRMINLFYNGQWDIEKERIIHLKNINFLFD